EARFGRSRDSLIDTRSDGVAALSVAGLAKSFGATEALRSCSFSVARGEIHTIVGENGSGKSTIVKILTGGVQPDCGTRAIGGLVTSGFRNPAAAIASGIVGVFQSVMTVGTASVLDNVWLGSDGLFRRRVPDRLERVRARQVLAELLGSEPDLDAPAEALSL